jgi:hypothetical protein
MAITFWLPQVEAAIFGVSTEGFGTTDFRDTKA